MFKVLYKPFPKKLEVHASAHAVIVWVSSKGQRIIIQGIHLSPEAIQKWQTDFETAVALLNSPPSLTQTKLWLRSIYQMIYDHDSARERYRRECSRRPFFRADFGRMDFSEPGQGGHGVDAWD